MLSDQEFVDKIVLEVKNQGHFDEFRKECWSDVDMQPAYQNLHSRIETTVQKFLSRQVWTPEIKNKNRLREEMRNNIVSAGFLDGCVSRMVDQVVDQKKDSIQTKVEEILYNYIGIKNPVIKEESQNGSPEKDIELPHLESEQISEDPLEEEKSVEVLEEAKSSDTIKEEEISIEDEDFESPAFEPIDSVVNKEKVEFEKSSNSEEKLNTSPIKNEETVFEKSSNVEEELQASSMKIEETENEIKLNIEERPEALPIKIEETEIENLPDIKEEPKTSPIKIEKTEFENGSNIKARLRQSSSFNSYKKKEERRSSILVKHDYLKSPCRAVKKISNVFKTDQDFRGFEAENLPENPWFKLLGKSKSESHSLSTDNKHLDSGKNNDSTINSKESETKMIEI